MVDGHGRAHPYRLGFASHLGVATGKPTIGVAKSRLIGDLKEVWEDTFLIHDGEIIGAAVSVRKGVKPVYVSVGHLVSLDSAIKIAKHCLRLARVPEPMRIAHNLASKERKAKIAAATETGAGVSQVKQEIERII